MAADEGLSGKRVRLAAPDPEADGPVMAAWSRGAEFMRLFGTSPARPLPLKQLQDDLNSAYAAVLPDAKQYPFVIRTLDEDRPIGVADLEVDHWPHREAFLGLALGPRDTWDQGYGSDALRVLLRYGFTELNLHRISLTVFDYNPRAIHVYVKAGFREEGRQRQRLLRDGQRWDIVYMGILQEEWRHAHP